MAEQLTTGRLDGLMLTPVKDDGGRLVAVDVTVDTLPGMRITIEAGAAAEIRYALGVLLERAG